MLGECFAQERRVIELGGIDQHVRVGRELGNGQLRIAGMHVDGLRADEDDGVAMFREGIERVEERSPCSYVLRVRLARHARSPSSTSGALHLQKVPGPGR